MTIFLGHGDRAEPARRGPGRLESVRQHSARRCVRGPAPWVHTGRYELATPLSRVWIIGWFGYLNWVLMLVNLIPALPFDGGRMLRAFLGSTSVVSSRDNPYRVLRGPGLRPDPGVSPA